MMISVMEKRVVEMTIIRGNFETLNRTVRENLNQKVTFDRGLAVDESTRCRYLEEEYLAGASLVC